MNAIRFGVVFGSLFLAIGCKVGPQAQKTDPRFRSDEEAYWEADERNDSIASLQLIRKLAAEGDPPYIAELGWAYQSGAHGLLAVDNAQAITCFKRAATMGNSKGMWGMGYMYMYGLGVKKDYAESMKWLQEAAAAGNAKAMTYIGYFYDQGLNGKIDYQSAEVWYEKASRAGDPGGERNLAMLYLDKRFSKQSYQVAFYWASEATEHKDPVGTRVMGAMLEHGAGVAPDLPKAKQLYLKAAQMGDVFSMHRIGWLSLNGPEKDYELANIWLSRAAKLGDANSMTGLGTMYEKGLGVPKDVAIARTWYEKGAAGGDASAKKHLLQISAGKQ